MNTKRCCPRPIPLRAKPRALALALAALASPLAASAQETAASRKEAAETLDTVVVTSSKRLEKQREVAGTVSVLDGGDLERRGARDQEDAFKLTPGVQLNKGDPNHNTVTIRGLATQAAVEGGGAQQEPTGFYLEDVPLASPIGKGLIVDVLPFDLDRIEILRGPQGALFGSGSLGGAVRYLFAKPDLENVGAAVQAGGTKYAQGAAGYSLYGMVNVPLSPGVAAARLVVFDRKDPGYIDNLGTGHKDSNEVRQFGGRVLFTVRPIRELTATLVASSQKTEKDDAFFVQPEPGRLTHNNPTDTKETSRFDFGSLTVDYDLGNHVLTSITGYYLGKDTQRGDDTALFASVGIPAPLVTRFADSRQRAFSEELRIASKPGGAFSYVAGLFYQRVRASSEATQSTPGFRFFPGAPETLVDLADKGGGIERAAFFDGEYALGGGWSVGGGGRYYRTSTDTQETGTVFGAPSNAFPPDGRDSGTTPKATVKYRFGDSIVYALAAKGYRYGGVNASPPFASYKSDSLWNYELGTRLTVSRDLEVDLTAFYMNWKDAQFTTFTSTGPIPFSGILNVGRARNTGLEIGTRYRFSPAFDVAATVAYLDAKTRSNVVNSRGGLIPAGSRLPGSAHLQTALSANARFDGPLGSQARFNATLTTIGDRVMDIDQNYRAGGFGTLDLGLNFVRDRWTLLTSVGNVFDKRGILSLTGTPGGGAFAQYYVERPRSFNVALRYDY